MDIIERAMITVRSIKSKDITVNKTCKSFKTT